MHMPKPDSRVWEVNEHLATRFFHSSLSGKLTPCIRALQRQQLIFPTVCVKDSSLCTVHYCKPAIQADNVVAAG